MAPAVSASRSLPTGLPAIARAPSGSHLCQLYRSREDLVETLVPYFAAGLANDERCLWICAPPLDAADAHAALRAAVADFHARERRGQIEIVDRDAWAARYGALDPDAAIRAWLDREAAALAVGWSGLRISGALASCEPHAHRAFTGRRVMAVCSYALPDCDAERVVELLRNHDAALVRREHGWESVHAAATALAVVERPEPPSRHSVEFFGGDDFPAQRIAEPLADALRRGEAAAMLVTNAHADALTAALAGLDVDPAARVARGQLVVLDVGEICTASSRSSTMCAEHDLVAGDTDRRVPASRLSAEIAQLHTALAAESEQRMGLAAARDLLVAQDRVSALFSEAACAAEVAARIVAEGRASLGAARVAFVAIDGGAVIERAGDPLAAGERARALEADAPEWTDEPAGAILPVVTRGRVFGAIVFALAPGRAVDAATRALAEDLARHAALALERVRVVAELERERERADRANLAKDEFLAMLSHELRNPLSPIQTAVHLLRLRGDSHDAECTIIERQVRHLTRLVDDLLDVSRLSTGKLTLRKKAVAIGEIVAHAIEQASAAIEDAGHTLALHAANEELIVDGDPTRLAQVIANLLVNAAKYTPRGGTIEVTVASRPDTIAVSVKDDGIGIAAEILPHVFDRFVQAPQGRDRAQGGLGLGLAIARAIVEGHGGHIRATSGGRGAGSELTIEIPRSAGPARAQPASAPAPAPAPAERAYRLLLVDDNADAAQLLAQWLGMNGYQVEVATDGPTALAAAHTFRPHVAIIDIGLPVMDGHELGLALNRELGEHAPQLVALTGYGAPTDRERSAAAGFRAHLVKPVDPGVIDATLRVLTSAASS